MTSHNNRRLVSALLCGGVLLATTVSGGDIAIPELVEVGAGVHRYRVSGEFLKNSFPVDAPEVMVRFSSSIRIMKYHVSAADYAPCVAEEACGVPFKGVSHNRAQPVTGVSFNDATSYAKWLSVKTGAVWRLPTDEEWSYVAGSRFFDDALGAGENTSDPSKRWLLKYRQSTSRDQEPDPAVKPTGAYGANKYGVYDLSGNVWEWTSTCYRRSKISGTGSTAMIVSGSTNCGVRVVEGRHRTYMTDFVQDAKSGGCAVGTPPDHLGFRLVRDEPGFFSIERVLDWLKRLKGS